MRNYSRKFRRNYRGGGFFDKDPKQAVIDAQKELDDANKKVEEATTKLNTAKTAEAAAPLTPPQESGSMTDKLKSMSPFGGGAPPVVAKASDSVTSGIKSVGSNVTSGVNSVSSGVKSMMPNSLKGGRRSNRRSNRRSKKNRRR
jgi:hypothetical protein